MERNSKIIIAVLVIIVIALVTAIGLSFFGDMNQPKTNSTNATVYNFDSAFTMEVPKGTVFKKSWNESNEFMLGISKTYEDKNKKFSVMYVTSELINDNAINFVVEEINSTGNVKVEKEGNLIIVDKLKKSKDLPFDLDKFKHAVLTHEGHDYIVICGNNTEKIVEMAKTINYSG